MKTSPTPSWRIPTRFRRVTEFELEPRFEPILTHADRSRFDELKTRLLKPVLDESPTPALRKQLSLAANEAAAVAWTTPFPLLVFPGLLEEKAVEVHEYAVRQEHVQEASHALLASS